MKWNQQTVIPDLVNTTPKSGGKAKISELVQNKNYNLIKMVKKHLDLGDISPLSKDLVESAELEAQNDDH